MTQEALKLALEALEYMGMTAERYVDKQIPEKAITAIKEALREHAISQTQGTQHMTPNTIEFRSTSDNTWVMRITADGRIEVNEDVEVTEAAQKVLDAMQYLLKAQRTWVGLTDDEFYRIAFELE